MKLLRPFQDKIILNYVTYTILKIISFLKPIHIHSRLLSIFFPLKKNHFITPYHLKRFVRLTVIKYDQQHNGLVMSRTFSDREDISGTAKHSKNSPSPKLEEQNHLVVCLFTRKFLQGILFWKLSHPMMSPEWGVAQFTAVNCPRKMRGMCFYPDKLVVNEVNEEYRPDLTFRSCVPGDYRNKKTAINKVVTNRGIDEDELGSWGSIRPGSSEQSPWAANDGRRENPLPFHIFRWFKAHTHIYNTLIEELSYITH